ncbi:MAG: hypothetical protein LBV45_03615 [Xanthomonadaceae bacterium]|jgi:hypothetical protein|nr:hypothetical protein [Xanthomonadaceae bacterium]
MFRILLILAAAALSGLGLPALAGPLVDVSVIDRDNGQWLSQYRYRGDTWVAGIPGHRYQVRLTNTTGERVLVVLSVDGVNAVSGETAAPSQAGYVLDPWESAEISGWRKSLNDIAQFVFTDIGDSYAARTGRPRNVGVIGIAVFQERQPYYSPPRSYSPSSAREEMSRQAEAVDGARSASDVSAIAKPAPPAPSADRQRIGTGHGAREWSRVEQTQFVRATHNPAQVTELRYDTAQRLTALGVIPQPPRHPQPPVRPSAFPNGFVPDPPRNR